jgi:hypothetical protein
MENVSQQGSVIFYSNDKKGWGGEGGREREANTCNYGARGVIVRLDKSIERLDGGINFCISATAKGRGSVLA